MSVSDVQRSAAFVACVPHVPLLAMQARDVNPELWRAYEQRIAEFKAFDPELVVVFGGDHYDGVHLKMMPTFAIAHAACGLDDCGGFPGRFDVPLGLAQACSRAVVNDGFDIATSYALEVDHGFTNVTHNFLGALDAKPVLPVLINAIADPKPTFKRCRQFGEAIGRFAATLNQRVAFLGSGGLSHETSFIFPQYNTAPNEAVRDFIVHGGAQGEISRRKWMDDIQHGMDGLSADLVSGKFKAPWINKAWDEQFMATFAAGDLTRFDDWDCEEVTRVAGYGGGEIRQWIAAAAAAQAMGVRQLHADYYSDHSKLAVGVGVAHGTTEA